MTERGQVTEAVADFKMGVKGIDDTAERIAAILGVSDTDVIRDILTEGENDPSDQIVNEIDAEYELDLDSGDRDDDEDDEDEFDVIDDDEPEAEGVEYGGEA
jgi:hypothetical protein